MKKAARFLVLACVVSAVGGGCGATEEAPSSTDQSIISGTVDSTNIAAVGLQGPLGAIYGSGTIVRTDPLRGTAYVLTAAHAALTTPYSIVYDEASGRRVQLFGTAQASRVHPSYNGGVAAYDVAVFEVSGAGCNTPVIPILSTPLDRLSESAAITVVGWGRFDEAGRAARTRHSMVKLIETLDTSTIAWDNGGTKASCSGDSGGPMLRSRQGKQEVVGVYHGRRDAGDTCLLEGSEGYGVRVENVRTWINDAITDLHGGSVYAGCAIPLR